VKNFLPYLKTLAFFAGLRDEAILGLAARFPRRRLADGEVLYEVGDPAGSAYVVVRGEIEVLSEGGHRISAAGAGDAIGLHELFRDEPRNLTARAIGETGLFEIDRAAFAAACEARDPLDVVLVDRVAHLLAVKLRQMDGILEEVDPHVHAPVAVHAPKIEALDFKSYDRSADKVAARPVKKRRWWQRKRTADDELQDRITELADKAGLTEIDSVKVRYGSEQPLHNNPSSMIRRG